MFYSKKFKKFKKVDHCFFSRKGGYSKGLYKGLNCGRGSKDNKKSVLKNLKYVSKKMKIDVKRLVLMHQTHSSKVYEVSKTNFNKKIKADALISKCSELVLGVVTADCVPILLYDYVNNIVGCIHAGWKGAYSGIIKKTILEINRINPNGKIYASIGPCIGQENYEVDIKFFKKFLSKSKKNKRYFISKTKHKKLFNLREFVADKLLELNVEIDHVKHDTFKEKYFFSYRRSIILKQKDYGRCISVIKLI